jgi:Zn-dependent alcohol dehydrogenase
MRAAVLEAQGRPLRVRDDLEIEKPRPGFVRVRVAHCGLCHSDLALADGTFPAAVPVVLGHEASGVVESIGPDVSGLAPGDPVVLSPCPPCGRCAWCVRGQPSLCEQSRGIATGTLPDGTTPLSCRGQPVLRGLNLGALAEYAIVPATGAVKIPADVPLDVACVIGCAVQTGVGAVLNEARVEPGASVLVTGLGGVGLSVVQGARLAGAARVLAADPIAARREAARAFGATDLIDPARDDVAATAHALTGIGVDYAFEAAGRGALIAACVAATRVGGTTVCVGAPPLGDALQIAPAAAFLATGKRILATLLGGCNSLREIPRLVALWRAGRLDLEALVTARRPLEEVNEGFADLAAGRGIRTVLRVWDAKA